MLGITNTEVKRSLIFTTQQKKQQTCKKLISVQCEHVKREKEREMCNKSPSAKNSSHNEDPTNATDKNLDHLQSKNLPDRKI